MSDLVDLANALVLNGEPLPNLNGQDLGLNGSGSSGNSLSALGLGSQDSLGLNSQSLLPPVDASMGAVFSVPDTSSARAEATVAASVLKVRPDANNNQNVGGVMSASQKITRSGISYGNAVPPITSPPKKIVDTRTARPPQPFVANELVLFVADDQDFFVYNKKQVKGLDWEELTSKVLSTEVRTKWLLADLRMEDEKGRATWESFEVRPFARVERGIREEEVAINTERMKIFWDSLLSQGSVATVSTQRCYSILCDNFLEHMYSHLSYPNSLNGESPVRVVVSTDVARVTEDEDHIRLYPKRKPRLNKILVNQDGTTNLTADEINAWELLKESPIGFPKTNGHGNGQQAGYTTGSQQNTSNGSASLAGAKRRRANSEPPSPKKAPTPPSPGGRFGKPQAAPGGGTASPPRTGGQQPGSGQQQGGSGAGSPTHQGGGQGSPQQQAGGSPGGAGGGAGGGQPPKKPSKSSSSSKSKSKSSSASDKLVIDSSDNTEKDTSTNVQKEGAQASPSGSGAPAESDDDTIEDDDPELQFYVSLAVADPPTAGPSSRPPPTDEEIAAQKLRKAKKALKADRKRKRQLEAMQTSMQFSQDTSDLDSEDPDVQEQLSFDLPLSSSQIAEAGLTEPLSEEERLKLQLRVAKKRVKEARDTRTSRRLQELRKARLARQAEEEEVEGEQEEEVQDMGELGDEEEERRDISSDDGSVDMFDPKKDSDKGTDDDSSDSDSGDSDVLGYQSTGLLSALGRAKKSRVAKEKAKEGGQGQGQEGEGGEEQEGEGGQEQEGEGAAAIAKKISKRRRQTQDALKAKADPAQKNVMLYIDLKLKNMTRSLRILKAAERASKERDDAITKKIQGIQDRIHLYHARNSVEARVQDIEKEVRVPFACDLNMARMCQDKELTLMYAEWVNLLPVYDGDKKWAKFVLEHTIPADLHDKVHLPITADDYRDGEEIWDYGEKLYVVHPELTNILKRKIKRLDTVHQDNLFQQITDWFRNRETPRRGRKLAELEERIIKGEVGIPQLMIKDHDGHFNIIKERPPGFDASDEVKVAFINKYDPKINRAIDKLIDDKKAKLYTKKVKKMITERRRQRKREQEARDKAEEAADFQPPAKKRKSSKEGSGSSKGKKDDSGKAKGSSGGKGGKKGPSGGAAPTV